MSFLTSALGKYSLSIARLWRGTRRHTAAGSSASIARGHEAACGRATGLQVFMTWRTTGTGAKAAQCPRPAVPCKWDEEPNSAAVGQALGVLKADGHGEEAVPHGKHAECLTTMA